MRWFIVAATLVAALGSGPVSLAQESCVGTITPEGMEFSGSGGSITEPFALHEGALFSDAMMTQAGALKLMNAAGDTILLGNAAEPYATREANTVFTAGDYYLVADFYGDDGDWSVTIEQPAG